MDDEHVYSGFDPERLIIVMSPAEEGLSMADVADDGPIIVTLIGKKSYLLTLVTTLASIEDTL